MRSLLLALAWVLSQSAAFLHNGASRSRACVLTRVAGAGPRMLGQPPEGESTPRSSRRSFKPSGDGEMRADPDDADFLSADRMGVQSWLPRFSLLGGIASFFEDTLADWAVEPERPLGREILRRTTVAVRRLESEWENFQTEVQSDVDDLLQLDGTQPTERSGGEAPVRGLGKIIDPSLRRAKAQLQAALNVLQREGWRDLEEVLTDAVPIEYHELLREVIARTREESKGPNATVLRKAIEIASQETQSSLNLRINAARRAIVRRRQQMVIATAEIKSDVLEIEREIETAFKELKNEWQRSLAAGELRPGSPGAGASTYSELREFVEKQIFQKANDKAGIRPTLAELRARWRAAALLPERAPALSADAEAAQASKGPLRVSDASDMRAEGRHITVVTTASIPWMTGTSVNPLLRASYLAHREGGRKVTLVLPWLEPEDQASVFPESLRFAHPAEQEAYIRRWGREQGSLPSLNFQIAWYPAAYSKAAGSILPTTDVVRQLPLGCDDIVVLEEPEHLNWSHHGSRWNTHFKHVVGIAHTNYIAYCTQFGPASMAANWAMTVLTVAAYCDVVIKLSDTLQWLPGQSLVRNVHGVRPDFLAIGARRATLEPTAEMRKGGYFLGKALYAKGYRELIDFTTSPAFEKRLDGVRLSCFGSGPDAAVIRAEAAKRSCALDFNPGIDHAHESLFGFHVFVNPSTSEVLCTATAEALAMGKIVVIPTHPSNAFFRTFRNARFFASDDEFAEQLDAALRSNPEPLTAVERYSLSWEAAIERLMDAAALPDGTVRQADKASHKLAYAMHYALGVPAWGDRLRAYTNTVPWKPYGGYSTPSRSLAPRAASALSEASLKS